MRGKYRKQEVSVIHQGPETPYSRCTLSVSVSCSTEKSSQWPTRGIKALASLWALTLLSRSWTRWPVVFFFISIARETKINRKKVMDRMSQGTPSFGMKQVSEIIPVWQCRSCSFKQSSWVIMSSCAKGQLRNLLLDLEGKKVDTIQQVLLWM